MLRADRMLDAIIEDQVDALYNRTKFPKEVRESIRFQYRMLLRADVKSQIMRAYPDLAKKALEDLAESIIQKAQERG